VLVTARQDLGMDEGMTGEIEGAAERFASAVDWLRRELQAVAAAVAPGAEPHAREQTADRYTTGGSMGKKVSISLTLTQVPFDTAAEAAAGVFRAAGWQTEYREGFGGTRYLRAVRDDYTAGVSTAGPALRIAGSTPVVWIHASWIRPPRAVTPETLRPGHRLCLSCEGWGSCPECEGLGFVDSRMCQECGLGMNCPDCRGAGQVSAP
jgi:hypothetical protein